MRHAVAVLTAVGVAALGALIAGEYDLSGAVAIVTGVLLAVVVAEVVLAISRRPPLPVALIGGVIAAGSMLWAAWISSGRDWDYVAGETFAAVPLAGVAGAAWITRSARRGAGSPPGP